MVIATARSDHLKAASSSLLSATGAGGGSLQRVFSESFEVHSRRFNFQFRSKVLPLPLAARQVDDTALRQHALSPVTVAHHQHRGAPP